jgi:hypothetical protein
MLMNQGNHAVQRRREVKGNITPTGLAANLGLTLGCMLLKSEISDAQLTDALTTCGLGTGSKSRRGILDFSW